MWWLAGEAEELKEYLLGTEVFDRSPSFDPQSETIVRVEARRLRRKLLEYYEGDGKLDPVRIDLPGPGYVPIFLVIPQTAEPAREPPPESPSVPRLPFRRTILVVGAALIGIGLWLGFRPHSRKLDSIAVLPFADLSAERNQEYFCDGVFDQVLDSLSSVPGLRVVARTSTLPYRNKAQDVREIGKNLAVDAVLEGSVRRSGNLFRITVQLIRADDGFHLWSRTFEREVKDIFATQDEIAQAVAGHLQAGSQPAPRSASRKLVSNPAAFDLYLQGRHAWSQETPEALRASEQHYLNAIGIEPGFALAYSGLAETYSYLVEWMLAPPDQTLAKARAAAEKALALDDSLAEAHTSLGIVAVYEWDWDRAERALRRAMELRPSYAYALHWFAHYLEYRNRAAEALVAMEQARLLDPLSRMYNRDLAMTLFYNRQYSRALKQVETVRRLGPPGPDLSLSLALIYTAQGRLDEALEQARQLRAIPPLSPMGLSMMAQLEARRGNRTLAEDYLRELRSLAEKQFVAPEAFAFANFALGNSDEAFADLESAFRIRSPTLLFLNPSPLSDPLRSDPRFQSLMKRMGTVVSRL